MDPVTSFLLSKTALADSRKDRDLALWRDWKRGGKKPEDLDPLLKAYAPVFNQKTTRWKAPAVPKSAFQAELQTQFIHALETYDPNRGAALNTHVDLRLRKAMRLNNRFQNFAYIPEGQASHIGAINKAHDELSEELGRAPTFQEIGKHIGLPAARVETIQKARVRDIRASDFEHDPTERGTSFEEQQLAVAKNILPQLFPDQPQMHELFHYSFGTGGYPQITSTGQLAKKMGKSPSQISRMKTELGHTLKQHMGL